MRGFELGSEVGLERSLEPKWSWEDIYAALGRERSWGEPLLLHPMQLSEPLRIVGQPLDEQQWWVPFEDGSGLRVEHRPCGSLAISLVPSAQPQVANLLTRLPYIWGALPAAASLLVLTLW